MIKRPGGRKLKVAQRGRDEAERGGEAVGCPCLGGTDLRAVPNCLLLNHPLVHNGDCCSSQARNRLKEPSLSIRRLAVRRRHGFLPQTASKGADQQKLSVDCANFRRFSEPERRAFPLLKSAQSADTLRFSPEVSSFPDACGEFPGRAGQASGGWNLPPASRPTELTPSSRPGRAGPTRTGPRPGPPEPRWKARARRWWGRKTPP